MQNQSVAPWVVVILVCLVALSTPGGLDSLCYHRFLREEQSRPVEGNLRRSWQLGEDSCAPDCELD